MSTRSAWMHSQKYLRGHHARTAQADFIYYFFSDDQSAGANYLSSFYARDGKSVSDRCATHPIFNHLIFIWLWTIAIYLRAFIRYLWPQENHFMGTQYFF